MPSKAPRRLDRAASLPPLIAALLRPEAHATRPAGVELVQTHISYVILAGEDVYKIKKPVDFGFLDFTTLESRRHFCEEEVRLNRRTCTSIYLGVLPITVEDGAYKLGGAGRPVEYAVHMRRLPRERMMDRLVETGAVTHDHVGRFAAFLADFHASAATSDEITRVGGSHEFERHVAENLQQVGPFVGRALTPARFLRIERLFTERINEARPLMRQREAEGRIRDGHGDLRSDAVCFDERSERGICIFDCIEFSERFRWSDVGLDVGFLAMDLHFRGRPDLADLFVGLYTAYGGDEALPAVLPPFEAYRAFVRGKVECLLTEDAHVPAAERRAAVKRSRRYFRLSEAFLRPPAKADLTLVMGVSGSGKSVLAGALASRRGAVLLSTDMVRNRLVGTGVGSRDRPSLDAGIYAPAGRELVYERLIELAERHLLGGRAVVLDGTFVESRQRRAVYELARRVGVRIKVIEAWAPNEVIEARQRQRAAEPWTTSEGRWEVTLAQLQRYEPPNELPPRQRRQIDTTLPLETQLRLAEGRVEKR